MIGRHIMIVCFSIFSLAVYGKSFKANDLTQFNKAVKVLQAGDSILLSSGIWKDTQLIFKGKGTENKQICLVAEIPGKVYLEGASSLRMSGEWLIITGLVFRNGHGPDKTVIDFRTSSKSNAYHTVLSNCFIDNFNQISKTTADHWVELWGKNNRIENCYFAGKTNAGTTLVVWPNDSNSTKNKHVIQHNYFGYRPPLGSNGGETIRIGTSEVCTNVSGTIVKENYFERCNGESEIISNKSCDNQFLNNTFFECEGSLTLRHGNRAIVSGNWFIGNKKKNTGGIRVINEGHLIFNNFFYQLRGKELRSPLAIMNGIPNTQPSGYAQVKNVVIANNTFLDCTLPWNFCFGANEENQTAKPENTLLINNLVYCPEEQELIKYNEKAEGIKLVYNSLISRKGLENTSGSTKETIKFIKMMNMDIPLSNSPAKKLDFLTDDIMGQKIGQPVIGAFQPQDEAFTFEIASYTNCGPGWVQVTK
ncbi:MAG: polysaccharide lyase 6 family protein [Prolixibacteraceae bacterium]